MKGLGPRLRGALAGFALALPLAACGGQGDEDSAGPWTWVGRFAFEAEDGRLLSPPLTLEDGAQGFALFVELEGCAQVAWLEDAEVWVSELEGGPSCLGCRSRFSVVAGSGVVVHAPETPSDGDTQIRWGRIDCETLTPSTRGEPTELRVWKRTLPAQEPSRTVPVVFRHGPSSPWSSIEASADLALEVAALLAPAGLDVVLIGSESDRSFPAEIAWFEGTPGGLPPSDGPDDAVEIRFAECLERVHPVLGSRTLLDGFVPRVPAQGTPGASIYLRHRNCISSSGPPVVRSQEAEAKLLAHELGHYLGLYHPEDAGGQHDRLHDTESEDTLMATASPSRLPSFLSPLQAERMRLHAALLAQGLPPDRTERSIP